MIPKILCVNGSLGGADGNTARLIAELRSCLGSRVEWRELTLSKAGAGEGAEAALAWADGFAFATGTYWDSWGSPLQRFLEDQTGTEATALWMGKPAAVLVTMHSVGGKGVLSRLQGVLNTLGCSIPPMSGMVYSLANHLALRQGSEFAEDLWQLDDLDSISHNLLQAFAASPEWKTWPVDREDPRRPWISD